jgi:Ca-activated chloride channel family protein
MQPQISFDRTVITTRNDEVVNVLIELTAPPAPEIERKPLDIVLVLDRSGSMGGQPLDSVTKAAAQLLRLVGASDRIGVVAFDDEVDLVLPLGQHNPTSAGRTVRAITAGGSTNLSGGWLKGLEMLLTDVREDALRRIIVLTDGHANAGITTPDELLALIGGGRARDVSTSCIGFGDGYDERLLAGLADAGRGNDYWCAGPDQAAAVFADEFAGLASVVAQNVSVEIKPSAAVAVAKVLNEFPITDLASGGVQVALGDAYGGETRKVVARFNLRPVAEDGALDVATLTFRWASTVGEVSLHTVTVPVQVTVGDEGAQDPDADPRVHEEVLVLEVARTRREARDAAEIGDYQAASALLRESATTLASMFAPPQGDLEDLRLDVQRLESGRWDAASSKKLFSRSRSSSRGRKTNYEDTPENPF